MRTGVLGGTFDPPHLGHLVLAASARRVLALDQVVFVPAGDPYRKATRDVSEPRTRIRMVEALIEHVPWARLSPIEVERAGPSYTADTLEALSATGGQWWFILGRDALADLAHWNEPQRIVAATRLAVADRGPHDLSVPEATLAAVPGIEDRIDLVPMPSLDASSTEVRARVLAGTAIEVLVPEGVRAVIDELGLYRSERAG